MKAIAYRNCLPIGEAESLFELVVPKPKPGARDLLVKVEAVSVNPVDVKLRAGTAPPEGGYKILGFDAAGTVEAVGGAVTLFKPGDAVFYAGSIARDGTNAEYHAVDERIVGRKPANLTMAEAAALPLTAITAWEILFERLAVPRGKLRGERAILAIGGAGGVGSILIQLARQLTELTVIASASRPETQDWCRKLGAHYVIDHRKKLADELRRAGIAQVEYIAALTETEKHFPAFAELIAPQGKVAVIDNPKTIDINPLKRKSVSVHWEYMFTRPVFETHDLIEQHRLLNEVAALVQSGRIATTMTKNLGRIDAANLKRAHAQIESGTTLGKIVLEGF